MFGGSAVTHVRINSEGLRGPELAAPSTDEVVMVGDSQVFGLGVEDTEAAAARHFELEPYRASRTLVRDDRPFVEPTVVDLRCAGGDGRAVFREVSWWVSYQRVATVGTGRDPASARIESEVRLHSGTLVPPP